MHPCSLALIRGQASSPSGDIESNSSFRTRDKPRGPSGNTSLRGPKAKPQASSGTCLSVLPFEPGLGALGLRVQALGNPGALVGSPYISNTVLHHPSLDAGMLASLLILACYVQIGVGNRTELFYGEVGRQSSHTRGRASWHSEAAAIFLTIAPKPSPC